MKQFILFILCSFSINGYAQYSTYCKYNKLIDRAKQYSNQGEYQQSLALYDQAFLLMDFVRNDYIEAFETAIFNSNYSKANNYLRKGALFGLDLSKWSFPAADKFNQSDFAKSYWKDKDSLLQIQFKYIDIEYYETLKKMEVLDQSVRSYGSKQMDINDSINFDQLIDLSIKKGFPTYKKTGFEGLNIAMLILMHNAKRAPYPDSNQWRKIIPYIKQEIDDGMLDPNFFKDIETCIERFKNNTDPKNQ